MKLFIDYKKLNDTNFFKDQKGVKLEEPTVQKLKNEILYGNCSSFLISGYRGAGKTSYIDIIENEVANENRIFVRLNLSKYSSYSLLMRKLIRSIYEEIPEDRLNKLEKDDKKLWTKLGLLYERTFNDISNVNKTELTTEMSNSLKAVIDFKKFILIFSTLIFSAINFKWDLLSYIFNYFTNLIGWVLLIGASIWGCVEGFKLHTAITKKSLTNQVLSRQSLYDDEIAEHRLTEILTELKEHHITFVFVFDELDKLDIKSVESIINETKSLMLSGLGTFLIVAGQQLYYKYYDSPTEDDSILSSLFANTFHIPLASDDILLELFNRLITKKEDVSDEAINQYFLALTLNSNRLPRKFMNLIREEIEWEGNKAYIDLEKLTAKNEVMATCLRVVQEIEESALQDFTEEYDKGIKDFLSYQLYRWIQMIIRKKSRPFQLEEITKISNEQLPSILEEYEKLLIDLSEILKDKLVEAKLLTPTNEGLNSKEYLVFNEVILNDEPQDLETLSHNTRLINQIINIESMIIKVADMTNSRKFGDTLEATVNTLVTKGYLKQYWVKHVTKILELISISEKLSKNNSLSANEVNVIQEAKVQINRLESEIREQYYYLKTRFIYNNQQVKVEWDNSKRKYADFILRYTDDNQPDILFEVKMGSSINGIQSSLNSLISYNQITQKKNKLVLIFKNDFDKKYGYERLANFVSSGFKEFESDIYLYIEDNNIEESYSEFLSKTLTNNSDHIGFLEVTKNEKSV
ncbi:P-loop NTPase fold protein [Halalkalibacter krulwichiae]|uniref:KAP family P-loop domain protein n=1 Tax=Halalkalibacter krulwichiae TaxID=199441 RepID=A0A1X9ML02_9BACI|nr:P-loop NTPase fold protein [Halalkalibacter krulwichiae]ARK32431.1 KAP family P-loop domain protein [Halalkalibacter krulwichiae]